MSQAPSGYSPPPPGAYAPALTYQPVNAQLVADQSHLRVLSIMYYVWGPVTILFSSIFIIHIVMGYVLVTNPNAFNVTPPAAPGTAAPAPGPMPPPGFQGMGWMFMIMGSAIVLLGWTTGVLTILAGRAIAKRRWRVFTMVMAGVNCLSVPFGTALGVFTFVVLLRDSVRALYEGTAPRPVPPPAGYTPPRAPGYN